MGKWLGGLITTLIILALTSVLGAALKGPMDDWVSRDRLQAEVQLAPWYPRPDAKGVNDDIAKPASDDPLTVSLAKLRFETGSPSNYGIARVTLNNNSSNTVTNVNFRLAWLQRANDAVVIDSEGKISVVKEVGRVKLPDMKPGDRAIVFMWGNFSSYMFPDQFQSFSSSGRFRVTYDWPTSQDRAYESGIGRFLDEYAGWAAAVSIAGLLILFFTLAVVYDTYFKLLLKDPNHYNEERARFLAAPTGTFQPKFSVTPAPPPAASSPNPPPP